MSAGSRKMPAPIVTLTMLAARAKVPMERRSDASGDEVLSVKVTNARIQLRLRLLLSQTTLFTNCKNLAQQKGGHSNYEESNYGSSPPRHRQRHGCRPSHRSTGRHVETERREIEGHRVQVVPRKSRPRAPASNSPLSWWVRMVRRIGPFTANYDGKDNPVTGKNPYGDTVALTRVDAKTTRITVKQGGKVTVTQTIVVSDDGKTRTTTTKGTDAKGQAIDAVSFYEKQ